MCVGLWLAVVHWAEQQTFGLFHWFKLPTRAHLLSVFILLDFWMYGWHNPCLARGTGVRVNWMKKSDSDSHVSKRRSTTTVASVRYVSGASETEVQNA